MKKYIVVLIALSLTKILYGQELKVDYFTANNDITASSKPRQHDGLYCAFVKVLLASPKATFDGMIVGEVDYKNSEYYIYLVPGSNGSKRLVVKMEGYLPLEVKFKDYGIDTLESKKSYILRITFERNDISEFKKKNVYIEPQIQIGGMSAIGASVGGYKEHLNVELSYLMGLTNSEEIYWNNVSATGDNLPNSYTYKPSFVGGKVGYAFYLGKPFRLTPQVGVGLVSLNGTAKQQGNGDIDATNGYALSASVSGRIDYLILPWLGVGVSPEYSLALSQSDLFERVADVSSKVKGFASGINVKIGVYVTF